MLNKFSLIIISLILSTSVVADTVAINPDYPESYVVKKGDTLWDISGKFLQEPWRWPDLWHANPQIKDPHLIYPGDVVSLVYQDGQPVLTVSRSGMSTTSGRNVKLSPTVRSYEKEDAIPSIPIDAIKQFLTRPLVVSADEMDKWPYVVSSYDEHLIAGSGNKIYVRGLDDGEVAKRYALYRRGDALVNPRKDENQILGYEAIYVGDAVVERLGDPASAVIAQSTREILVGDRLTEETEADISVNFTPRSPAQSVNGNVVSAIDVVSEIGQHQIVVVDVGTNHGIEVGNVLGIYQSGKIINDSIATERKAAIEEVECEHEHLPCSIARDVIATKRAFDKTELVEWLGKPNAKPEKVELPEEFAGVLMVFRTFDNVSYALVMEATSPIHLYDTVKNL